MKCLTGMRKKVEEKFLSNYQNYYRLAYSYVKNESDAMDIVQESAYKAIKEHASLKKEEYISSWIYRIVINTYLDYIRNNRKEIVGIVGEEEFYEDTYMKQEYKDIPIPSSLKRKVEGSIMKGKKDNMKKNAFRYTKVGTMTAAAALLAIVILANSNSSIAYAMKKIPIIGAITNVVTFKTYQNKTNDFEANIKVPKIETDEKDENIKQAADEVNKSVEDYTNMLIKQYNEDMKASEGKGNYAVDTSYQVITNNDKIFTLRIDTVVAMGGSNSFSKFYHIDKESGRVITLKDLFKEDADYITAISNSIKQQMKEQMETDESITYFLDNEETKAWNFVKIKGDQNFYFNKDGELVMAFDKYEVAPGYMGMVEFAIPKEVTKSIMR